MPGKTNELESQTWKIKLRDRWTGQTTQTLDQLCEMERITAAGNQAVGPASFAGNPHGCTTWPDYTIRGAGWNNGESVTQLYPWNRGTKINTSPKSNVHRDASHARRSSAGNGTRTVKNWIEGELEVHKGLGWLQIAEELLCQGDVWMLEIAQNPMSYVFWHKEAPGVHGGNLVCATGAAHARFRSDASSIVK